MLVEINNAIGMWLGEICAAFWFLASLSLAKTWYRHKNVDPIVVFAYLTCLLVAANIPTTWADLTALSVIHVLLYTSLVGAYGACGALRTGYGSILQNMAALLVFIDVIVMSWSVPIQYHAWILAIIYLYMCLSTLYVCLQSHHNGGNMGKPNDLATRYNKIISNTAKV